MTEGDYLKMIQTINKRIDNSSIFLCVYSIFLLSYMILVSNLLADYPQISNLATILHYAGFVSGIFVVIRQNFNFKELFFIIILGSIILISGYNAKDYVLFNSYFLIVIAKNINFEKVVKFDLKFRIFFSLFLFTSTALGLITNRLEFRTNDITNDITMRQSLGFGHPNKLGINILLICIYLIYSRRNRLKIYDLMSLFIALIFVSYLTGSRSSEIGIILLIVLVIKQKFFLSWHMKSKNKIITCLAIVFIFASLYFSITYNSDNQILNSLNTLFSARIELGHIDFLKYGFPLFGQKINYISWVDANPLGDGIELIDNLYMYLGINFGIVVLILYSLALIKLIIDKTKEDFILGYCILIIIAVGCIENQVITVESNIFLLCIANIIYSGNKKKMVLKDK